MHLRLRKCEKSPQTYRKLAVAEHLLQFAVAELSVNLRCPVLEITCCFMSSAKSLIHLCTVLLERNVCLSFFSLFCPSAILAISKAQGLTRVSPIVYGLICFAMIRMAA